MLYTSASVGMAGCCAGSDTELCGWSDRCVDYSGYVAGNCGTDCMLNDFVRKCTDVAAPFCVTWTYPGDGIADYGCAATSTNTVYTVLQRATDQSGDSTSMTLPTMSGNAVTGFNEATDTAIPTTYATSGGYGDDSSSGSSGGSSSTSTHARTKKKLAIGAIIGIVVVVLFVIFFVIMGVFFCLKKKKKQRQLAENAQAVAAAQATRPQSMFPQQQHQPPMQMPMQQGAPPMQQQGGFVAPMPPQSPQPTINGYFAPPGQSEQKFNAHTSVHEYAATPVSNPTTPAPAYSQPYGNPGGAPMPGQSTMQPYHHTTAAGAFEADSRGVSPPAPQQAVSPISQYQGATGGAHEVDAISVPQGGPGARPVYEMGQGR